MNTSDFRSLHAQYDPDNAEPEREPSPDPNAFVATLHRIASEPVRLRTASLGPSGINCLGGVFSWRMQIARWRGCVWWRS